MRSRFSVLAVGAKGTAAVLLMVSLIGVVVSVDVPAAAAVSIGQAIANAAASQAGVPYCEGGGGDNGPSSGTGCTPPTVGYDCMSLAQYAVYQVTGITVPSNGEMLPAPIPPIGTVRAPISRQVVVRRRWHRVMWCSSAGRTCGTTPTRVSTRAEERCGDALQTGTPVGEHTMADLTSIYGAYDGGALYSGSGTPPPTTSMLVPSNGAAVHGTLATLDAQAAASDGVGISSVKFVITGGSYNQSVIGTAAATEYGYVLQWNTTTVPGGTYTVQSLATDGAGNTTYSSGISVTVDNTPPTTSMLVPSTGAAVHGTAATLDAKAAASFGVGISSVKFVITGGSYNKSVVGTAVLTEYGYLSQWNTTTIPGGTYTVQSLATDGAGNTTYSSGISVTVDNTPPTTSMLVPSTGAVLNGTAATLDAKAAASFGVGISSVKFVITGGSYNKTVVGTAVFTEYGYLSQWNTTTVSDGTYTVQSLATDGAGNTTYSSGISVTVDN